MVKNLIRQVCSPHGSNKYSLAGRDLEANSRIAASAFTPCGIRTPLSGGHNNKGEGIVKKVIANLL